MNGLQLTVEIERFPIAGAFTISRGSRTEAVVLTATLSDGVHRGRGECVPYARYGETVEGVAATVEAQAAILAGEGNPARAIAAMKAGAARNALDCALWDLRCKRAGRRAWELAGLAQPEPAVTCYTISLGTPDAMEAAAGRASGRPLLKVKLGGEGDVDRIAAVRRAAPGARIVVDANEAWRPDLFAANMAACEKAGVELIEQPFPAADDGALKGMARTIPICADESFHGLDSLERIAGLYDAVNVKLDKTGGLSAALEIGRAAAARGMPVMVGCMLGTSLAMAPATLLTAGARFVDLDGPLLLARDREHSLSFEGGAVHPPEAALWG